MQEDVVEDAARSSNFAGLRAAVDLWQFVSTATGQFVTAPLEKLDTLFTLALVVKI